MTAKNYLSKVQQHEITATRWSRFLDTETHRVRETGVHAAILRISIGNVEQRVQDHATTLLRRKLDRTSTFRVDGGGNYTALMVPVPGVVELQARVSELYSMFDELQCSPTIGYALRRDEESLVDTMARADASVDRELFRSEGSRALLVLPE